MRRTFVEGGQSAQGDSVKARPMKDPNVLRIQIEIDRQQRAQFAELAPITQRSAQLDHPAPFMRGGVLGARATGQKMRVVLGRHGTSVGQRRQPRP